MPLFEPNLFAVFCEGIDDSRCASSCCPWWSFQTKEAQEAKGWLMSEKLYCQKTTIPNKTFKAKKMTIEKWEALMHNEILMEISTGRNAHLRNYFICCIFITYNLLLLMLVCLNRQSNWNQKWIYSYVLYGK